MGVVICGLLFLPNQFFFLVHVCLILLKRPAFSNSPYEFLQSNKASLRSSLKIPKEKFLYYIQFSSFGSIFINEDFNIVEMMMITKYLFK